METGATTTAHDASGSKPCSVPMATDSPRSRTSRSRVTTTSCCSRMARTERTVSTASKDSASVPDRRRTPGRRPGALRGSRRPTAPRSTRRSTCGTRWPGGQGWATCARPGGGEQAPGAGQRLVGGLALEVDRPLLDRAVGEHHHHQRVQRARARRAGRTGWWPFVRGADHHGGVRGQLGEQARGPLEHRLHLAVDLVEELRAPCVAGPDRAPRARPGGPRRSGSPCRSGCGPHWCGAGPGSPRAPAPPSPSGRWPRTP